MSVLESLKKGIDAYGQRKERLKQRLIAKKEEKLNQLRRKNGFVFRYEPFDKVSDRYDRLLTQQNELKERLDELSTVNPSGGWVGELFFYMAEFALTFWFITFVLYRLMGAEFFKEQMPTFGLNISEDSILIFIVIIESILVVVFTVIAKKYNENGYSIDRYRKLMRFFIAMMILFLVSLGGFVIVANSY